MKLFSAPLHVFLPHSGTKQTAWACMSHRFWINYNFRFFVMLWNGSFLRELFLRCCGVEANQWDEWCSELFHRRIMPYIWMENWGMEREWEERVVPEVRWSQRHRCVYQGNLHIKQYASKDCTHCGRCHHLQVQNGTATEASHRQHLSCRTDFYCCVLIHPIFRGRMS